MKDKNVFEKARMNGVLIPLAGFVAAAALILAVIFISAYFGAFTGLSDKEQEHSAEFEEPAPPSYDYGIETVNEEPEVEVEIRILEFTSSDDGDVSYKLKLVNNNGTSAKVTDARCMMYEKEKCVKSSTLAKDITLEGGTFAELSGVEKTDGADTVIFYVSWEDQYGSKADAYTVCKKK